MVDTVITDLIRNASMQPERLAVADKKISLTYAKLLRAVRHGAAILKGKGVSKGDKVAILAVSRPDYVIAYLAAISVGAVSVPVDKTFKLDTIDQVCRLTEAKLYIGEERQIPQFCIVNESFLSITEFTASALSGEDWKTEEICPADITDESAPAEILFTSGTTGIPKGVVLSYRAIAASMRNTSAGNGIRNDDIMLLALPLGHSFGMRVLRACLHVGASVVLQNGFAFARTTQDSIEKFSCTAMAAVPATLGLMETQMRDKLYELLGKLRYIEFGAGSLSPAKKRELQKALPQTEIHNTWGSTETGGAIFLNMYSNSEKSESIGRPIDGIEVRVRAQEGSLVEGFGESNVGRMELHGDLIMSGYLKREKESGEALKGDWLVTNDLVWRDKDGFIYMLGRADDMINTGGEKVSPVEVENVAAEYAGIRECACVGGRDPKGIMGEIPVLFAVAKDASFSREEVIKLMSQRLERYKLPKAFVMLDELPRGRTQKVDRSALKRAWEEKIKADREISEETCGSKEGQSDGSDAVLACIKNRHSIRKFKDKEISKALLEKIVDCAVYAPTGKNMQTWRFTVLSKTSQIVAFKSVVAEAAEEEHVRVNGFNNPAAIVLVSNDMRNKNGACDCACAAENMMLAATACGLGSVWINCLGKLCDNEKIREQLRTYEIPDGHHVWAMIALGYPDEEPRSPKRNKSVIKYV